MRDTSRISWRRGAFEGAVIVTSILLAFGIDAWWDGVQQRQQEARYLAALQREFTQASRVAQQQQGRIWPTHAVEALIGQVQGDPRAPVDTLLLWSSGLSQQIEFDPPRAVYDDLISSGGTQLIRSDSLRSMLARYASQLDLVRYADRQAWAIWEQRIQPLLEGRIPRVDRIRKGTAGRAWDVPFGASVHSADWEGLFADPAFEDVLAERWLRLKIASYRLDDAVGMIGSILEEIDDELRSR